MSSLPPDLTPDILSHLPIKDLLRFKCVSSSWRSLIDSPYFAKLHLSCSQRTRSNLFVLDNKGTGRIRSLGFDSLEKTPEILQLSYQVFIAGSCNGVVALHNLSEGDDVALWNPSTRKLRKLPSSKFTARSQGLCCIRIAYGFGYDSVMDDYKLVRISQFIKHSNTPSFSKAEVFSLKMDTWREIECPYPIRALDFFYARSEALVNNALHWLSYFQPREIKVVGFDLAKEEFYLVPSYPDCGFSTSHHVGVLGGCLSMTSNFYDPPPSYHVWVMKDYRVKESWLKLFFLTLNMPNEHISSTWVIPIAYSRDHRRILLNYSDHFSWYDLSGKTLDSVDGLDDDPCFSKPILCLGSLVALDWRKENNQL